MESMTCCDPAGKSPVPEVREAEITANLREARCLGLIDDPRARAALIRTLAEPRLPAEIRAACIEALESQIRRSPAPAVASARRWRVLAASRRARQAMADVTADQLAELAEKTPAGQRGPLVYGDAFEIIVPDAGTTRLDPRFDTADDRRERLAKARELITHSVSPLTW